MYAIQALANASRSGTWDEQTLIALENSLFSQGRIYNNDTHTLSAADIDALITYEDGIIFREFGNWLEGGGAYIIAGVTMIGMDYFVTHGADRIVDRLYSGGNKHADLPQTEVFYRTMSKKDYEHLRLTGELPATSETFISPTESFSRGYDGVTVKFEVKSGTTNSLLEIGVSNNSNQSIRDYGMLPQVTGGWNESSAFFKGEGIQTNIGLGQGRALEIFNSNILGFEVVGGGY